MFYHALEISHEGGKKKIERKEESKKKGGGGRRGLNVVSRHEGPFFLIQRSGFKLDLGQKSRRKLSGLIG